MWYEVTGETENEAATHACYMLATLSQLIISALELHLMRRSAREHLTCHCCTRRVPCEAFQKGKNIKKQTVYRG